ncbi:hypothetical protein SDC9_53751 [bioreactor metagenome]|uniref:Uncharacterized protein n=1 Tax=bioreactor metagenome TaxID=1076179 RepID=A0A644WU37_9ZZZZ
MNLGIPFKLRITKYDGKPYFQHVYVVVPNGASEIIIDPVLNQFNYEKQFSGYKDYTMEGLGIPIFVLHGVDDTPANVSVIDNLLNGSGIGSAESHEQSIYNHLVETRNNIVDNPGIIDSVDYTPGFLQMLNYAIDNFWKGPQARAKAFEFLAANEAAINKKNGITTDDLDSVNDPEDDYMEGFAGVDESEAIDDDDVYHFNGIGELAGKKEREDRKKAKTAKKAQKKAEKAQKKVDKKAERKEEKAENKQERKQAKGFFRKVGVALKQGGEKFVKYNPLSIAARNGFLLALRLNMGKMSSKLKWAYATQEQAKAGGISDKRYQASKKALAQVEKLFDQKLQGSKVSLKNAILSGKHNIQGFDDDYIDIDGLGVVEEATIAAAIPVIVAAIDLINNQFSEVDEEEGETDMWDEMSEFADSDLGKIQLKKLFSKKQASKTVGPVQDKKADKKASKKASKNAKKANKSSKESWVKKAWEKVSVKNADKVKSASQEINADPANNIDPDLNPDAKPKGDESGSVETLLTKIGDFVQSNPLLTMAIVGGAAYVFIPNVRDGVNNMFGGSKSQKQSGTSGLGKLPAPKKTGKKIKKVSSIKFR